MKTFELTQEATHTLIELLKSQMTRLTLAIEFNGWNKEKKESARVEIGKLQTLKNYLEAEQ